MTLPGFELLYSSVQSQLRSPQDAIVSAIHWNIISCGFKLTGVGENPASERLNTETLPNGWNSGEIYVLHYETTNTDPKQSYLLKILPVDQSLLLHFQRENDENVTTLELPVQEYTSEDLSSVTSAFRNMDRLNNRVRDSMIDPAMGASSSSSARGGADKSEPKSSPKGKKKDKNKSPLLIETGPSGYQPRPMQPAWGGGMGGMDPFSVGRSDLDPLAGMGGPGMGGGGMIMDPRRSGGVGLGGPARGGGIHPGSLPPGSVPAGARFDHIGPPGMRSGPDPDHEQPPGYDDMFM
ncbi:proteasome inhibitor PI31 subunit-like [Littorina saxatilis]|uniref:Proteasome inhibitor PI31 subunit n=1 Tax=Littorina saxatilis TaxID=31220 RepID=A0AAN9AR99_9CAEN